MRIRYQFFQYEMTFFNGIKFHVMSFWFPFRRFLRAVKRSILYLRSWVSTLVIFIPICLIAFYFLLRFKQMELSEAHVELTLLLLGSVALLAIKELRDGEVSRHRRLQQQWGCYVDRRYELESAMRNLAEIAGGQLLKNKQHGFPSFVISYDAMQGGSFCGSSDKNKIIDNAGKIRTSADTLLADALRIGFIDWNYSYVKNSYYRSLCDFLDKIIADPSRENLSQLANGTSQLLEAAVRPWHYRNDVAHRELLERFVNTYGVKL